MALDQSRGFGQTFFIRDSFCPSHVAAFNGSSSSTNEDEACVVKSIETALIDGEPDKQP